MQDSLNCKTTAVQLITVVWASIDWENISPMRRMKIYDEFASKVKSSACTTSIAKFLENLCKKFGIASLKDTSINSIVAENNEDVLRSLREETQHVMLIFRDQIEEKKKKRDQQPEQKSNQRKPKAIRQKDNQPIEHPDVETTQQDEKEQSNDSLF